MIKLGKKSEISGVDELKRITDIHGRPTAMPELPSANHRVICGYNQGLGEHIIVCESLEDMQELYDAYYHGGAISIRWYIGDDPGFVVVLSPGQKLPE